MREYLRVSNDGAHTGRSPDQQHAENVRAIEREGWALAAALPYRDIDRSASRYAKHAREDFERLMVDLETDEFRADVLAIWESSRGSRRVGEWVDLVDLCKEKRVRIWVTTHGRLYDPNNARDRRSLLEDAVDAEYESDKISERRRRSARAAAEEGRPHGKNIYGYRRIYDEHTRALLRVEPIPEQAAVVEEAARRVLSHDSFYAIAADFNARGVPARNAKRQPPFEIEAWSPSAIKQMLRLPAYAGKRDHRGEIIGDGMWPAIISFEMWQALQSIMRTSQRKGPRDHTAKHLLTGIAQCGVCGARMKCGRQNYAPRRTADDGTPLPRRTYLYYVCSGVIGRPRASADTGWHTGMKALMLDEIVIDLVLERLAAISFTSSHKILNDDTRIQRAELTAEIAAHEKYLDEVRTQAAAAHRFELILDQEARLLPVIDAARLKIAELSSIDPVVRSLSDAEDMREAWNALDLADQRRVIRATVTPVVHRVERGWAGRRDLNRQRVEPIWS